MITRNYNINSTSYRLKYLVDFLIESATATMINPTGSPRYYPGEIGRIILRLPPSDRQLLQHATSADFNRRLFEL